MKSKMNLRLTGSILFLLFTGILISCEKEDEIQPPIANFIFAIDTENTLEVTFTSLTQNATSFSWSFGDGIGTSNEESPTYTYTDGGTYTVTLTASNEGGSGEFSADLTVSVPLDIELLTNGTFEDNTGWTVINHYEATNLNGTVTFEDGIARWDETTNTDWKHMGIYTMVDLEIGTYQFDMDVTFTEINDVWGEVYLDMTVPEEGSDYGSAETQILKAYNAWDCEPKTYSGKATLFGCDTSTNPGQMEITQAGSYYLLFRTGGGTYGTTGIVVDNFSLKRIN